MGTDYLNMTAKLIRSMNDDQAIRLSTERGSTRVFPLSTPSTGESDRNDISARSSGSQDAKNIIQGDIVAGTFQPGVLESARIH